ncbi:pantoate--beta-alanine ligase [Ekhidna sp.]
MRVLSAKKELSDIVSSYKKESKTIGFVPTMGALHEGHLALVKRSIEENDRTIVSIFVNPLQFNSAKDLAKYPRVLEEDVRLLEGKGVDLVFAPSEKDLYPSKQIVTIDFGDLSEILEGKYRPDHFDGVGVIVSKLLHLTLPSKAYFGLKDLQQFILIRRMCKDLSFACQIVGVDTVRETTGLAMSSRNRQLSDQGLKNATVIYEGLSKMGSGIDSRKDLNELLEATKKMYEEAEGFDLEYLEAIDPSDLSTVSTYRSLNELAICVAGYVEGIRLIDNLYLRLK